MLGVLIKAPALHKLKDPLFPAAVVGVGAAAAPAEGGVSVPAARQAARAEERTESQADHHTRGDTKQPHRSSLLHPGKHGLSLPLVVTLPISHTLVRDVECEFCSYRWRTWR